MGKRVFISCFNQQKKIWNCSYGSIVGAVIFAVILGTSVGFIWGLGAGGIGFTVGGWIDKNLYLGKCQRLIYWLMPYSSYWLSGDIPESSQKYEL